MSETDPWGMRDTPLHLLQTVICIVVVGFAILFLLAISRIKGQSTPGGVKPEKQE